MSQDLLTECQQHYVEWNDDNEIRRTRENGWNDVIDAYNNKLPENWPYLSRVVDPRIRTTLLEKKARLTNAKLRGRLVPREGGDVLKARLSNAVLDYQWDTANEGGSMNAKWGEMDIDTRMFGSKFAYVPWEYKEIDKKVLRNGNGFRPLDPNNCGIDPNCTHIRDARWFQMREFVTMEELESENSVPGIPKYPGLKELKKKVADGVQDTRDANWIARNLQLKGIEDRLGRDRAFPVLEKITEFRPDKVIIFFPRYNMSIAEFDNPYKHRSIPIVQNRYYPLLNDPWGEVEVEAWLPIWRAIQALICGYLDTMNIHMRPPLKVLEGQVRMETIQWGPEATWIMSRLDAVQEHAGTGESLRYFQATYTSLVSAFQQASGGLSQGVSQVDPFANDKTATEIKQVAKQQNVGDQDNQNYLADAIQDMMRMWQSNNQQFLFADPDMSEYILQIVGKDMFSYFQKSGLDQMVVPDASLNTIKDIVDMREGGVSPEELQTLHDSALVPLHPVIRNPKEKNPAKYDVVPKMRINKMGDSAEISLVPDDFEGTYNYIADVKSMSAGANEDMLKAQNQLFQTLINPQVTQMLVQQGYQVNVKELLDSISERSGITDPDRFVTEAAAGPGANIQQPGLPGVPPTDPTNGQQMAGPAPIQIQPGVAGGILPGMGGSPSVQGTPPIA